MLLVIALLGAGLVWHAQSRGFTAQDVLSVVDPPPPEPCSEPDPTTTSGCLTPTALRLHDAAVARFGEPGPVPVRSSSCWSEHAWNPASDHPAGQACDFFPGRFGEFPEGDELAAGWEVAGWLRENAADLGVRHVIWQGRIWSRGAGDTDGGWGRPYGGGGGVYDADDGTGGHFDHIHVDVRR